MAVPEFRVPDIYIDIETPDLTPEFWLHDLFVDVERDGLVAALDHVVALVAGQVGHSRVYNRERHTRSRQEFESLFVDSDGMEFWTVRRVRTKRIRVGTLHAMEYLHTVQIEGHVRHKDADLAADATESQLQTNAELVADAIRPDTTLGGLVELSWLGVTAIDDVEYAGIACHRVQIGLQAQEFLTD